MSWINLGKKIKQYRKTNNLTQQELANKLGISRSTLSYYEKGDVEPNIYTILKLSEIMNCSLDYLFDIENTKELPNYSSFFSNEPNNINIDNDDIIYNIKTLKKLIKKFERNSLELEATKKRFDLMYNELQRTQNRLFKIDEFFTKLNNLEFHYQSINKSQDILNNSQEEFSEEIIPEVSLNEAEGNDTHSNVIYVNFRKIPKFDKVPAGAPGYPNDEILEHVYIPENNLNPSKKYFAISIDGDSMNKVYAPGEVVLVEKDAFPENNDLVIASISISCGETTFKKIDFEDNKILLIPMSTNPIHKVQIYNIDDIIILGKVIGPIDDFLN